MAIKNRNIVLFDGVCNLCDRTVSFIQKRDRHKVFSFLPLQSDKGKELLLELDVSMETDSVIYVKGNVVFFESEAILKILELLPAPWKWFKVFNLLPKSFLNVLYKWIARNRYFWFGKKNSTCQVI